MELRDMSYRFFIVFGLLEDDRQRIIAARPWRLGKSPILIRSWIPNISPSEESKRMITALWPMIKHLPIEYHTLEILIEIGKLVGKTVALNARNVSQVYQEKLCTEVDILTKLPLQISINNRYFHVFFENLHIFSPLFMQDHLHSETHTGKLFTNQKLLLTFKILLIQIQILLAAKILGII